MIEENQDGRALREPALVSDQAPAGLDPTGFDPARDGRPMIETNPAFRDVILRALTAMSDTSIPECYWPFAFISAESGLPLEQTKAVVRFLANLEYAEFARGLMTDDGAMAGSGYALTRKGHALRCRVEAIAMEARQGGDACGSVHDSAGRQASPKVQP